MTTEGGSEIPTHNQHNHNLLDWLDDSIPFLPSFLDEPYPIPTDLAGIDWWSHQSSEPNPDHLYLLPPAASAAASLVGPVNTPADSCSPIATPQPELSKKRRRRPAAAEETEANNSSDSEVHRKPPVNATGRKASGKLTGGNSNNSSKEVRWAEQLLNPLATAIAASNLSRVQHLLYVLQELALPTGDANHRLALHGLYALTRHHSPTFTGGDRNPPPPTFATTEPKLFRSALIRFHEVSPWFAFPNSLANASILQTLTPDSYNQRPRNLHVVDLGVSHGIQWPTLLEALTRRYNGAPSLVRLTIAGDAIPQGPFSSPPPGYDFSSHLLRYAKSIDLNLKIDRASDLAPRSLDVVPDEVLVICAQFRAQHCDSDQRMAFLRSVRELDPDLVVLTEIEGGDGTAAGFARRAEMLWRFLDSTSAAFKGRDCVERRVVEGEMGRVLEEGLGFGEGRERWRERMLGLRFREEGFGEEAVDGGRALLRKYDGNWEMRPATAAEAAVGIGLWWKGQPVSFCSIWKTVS